MARRVIPVDPTIGARVEARRELRGWSVRHAASRAGVAHTTWSRVERGELRADRYMLADLAAALECSMADLTGQPHPPGDRALETAQARAPRVWLAMVETAPDEPAKRPAQSARRLADRVELLTARRLASEYADVVGLLPDILVDLHSAAAGRDAHAALRLTVDATHTAMLTLRHLGYGLEPTLAAERCRQAAERLDEPVALALADWVRAHAAFGAGAYGRAATLATRNIEGLAAHLGEPTAHEVLGMLHLTAAVATLRDRPADARGHLDEADRLAAATGETTTWSLLFGPANVAVWRVQAEVDAGEPARALAIADQVDPMALSTARRASYHVERARALADLRRDQDATRQLLVAERTGPQLTRSSTAARETARFLLHRARRDAGGSGLRGLCERLRVAA